MEILDIFDQPDRENLISQYHQQNTKLIEEIVQAKPDGVQIISDNSIIITDRDGNNIFATPFGASFASENLTDQTHLMRLYTGKVRKTGTPENKNVFDVTPYLTAIISRTKK